MLCYYGNIEDNFEANVVSGLCFSKCMAFDFTVSHFCLFGGTMDSSRQLHLQSTTKPIVFPFTVMFQHSRFSYNNFTLISLPQSKLTSMNSAATLFLHGSLIFFMTTLGTIFQQSSVRVKDCPCRIRITKRCHFSLNII